MTQTRFLFTYAIFCAAALCLSSSAKAQSDLPNWTGFYIGGNLGGLSSNYGFGHFTDGVDVDAQSDQLEAQAGKILGPHLNAVSGDGEPTPFGTASFAFPDDGFSNFNSGSNQSFLGGGQVGYNHQFGHWVIGVEGDFQGTSANGKQLSSGFTETSSDIGAEPPPAGFGETVFADTTLDAVRKAETDWSASLRARFGYTAGPFLFYGTAGLAWTDVKVTATETASTDFFEDDNDLTSAVPTPRGKGSDFLGNVTSTNFSKTSDDVQMGWTGGVGAEWAINDKVTMGVEYRHSDYGSHTYHFASNEGVIFPGDTKVDLDTDQVTLRFNILVSHFFGH
jgi:outer membrane immunogenic protein